MPPERVRVPVGHPSPRCAFPCHRRADFAYRDAKTGERVFRAWCRPHRLGQNVGTPRPRPYLADPDAPRWPDEVRCPFCENKREARQKGVYRRTCKNCRGKALTPPKKKKVAIVKMRVRKVPSIKAPPPPPSNPLEVSFLEGGKRLIFTMRVSDGRRLRQLWREDTGHYVAATDPELSRKYPTAAIAALWHRWSQGRP